MIDADLLRRNNVLMPGVWWNNLSAHIRSNAILTWLCSLMHFPDGLIYRLWDLQQAQQDDDSHSPYFNPVIQVKSTNFPKKLEKTALKVWTFNVI